MKEKFIKAIILGMFIFIPITGQALYATGSFGVNDELRECRMIWFPDRLYHTYQTPDGWRLIHGSESKERCEELGYTYKSQAIEATLIKNFDYYWNITIPSILYIVGPITILVVFLAFIFSMIKNKIKSKKV